MNLVLIGYRGTGKTAIGRRLAERLGLRYVGLDAEICNRAGKPIPAIVEESGWEMFRDLESEVTLAAAGEDDCLLDTGGGVILRGENVKGLRQNAIVFWLTATVPEIVQRIGGDDQRPSLTGTRSFTDEVEDVLAERKPKYAAAADHVVDTSRLSLEEAVTTIADTFTREQRATAGQKDAS